MHIFGLKVRLVQLAKPVVNVPNASVTATPTAFFPIFFNFSIENSIPTTNEVRLLLSQQIDLEYPDAIGG